MALGLTRKLLQLLPDRDMVHMIMEMDGNRSFTLTTGKAERSRLPPEMITEPECRSGLRPEFGIWAGAGAEAGVNIKVCAGANQNF